MAEVKKKGGGGTGGNDRTAQSTPPYLNHTPSNAKDRCHMMEWDKGSRGERSRLGTSVSLRVDSTSKTKLRQEKEKEKEFRIPKTSDPH